MFVLKVNRRGAQTDGCCQILLRGRVVQHPFTSVTTLCEIFQCVEYETICSAESLSVLSEAALRS